MASINGIQLNTKPGIDFNNQYNVPDTGLTNNTTLNNNPLYNLLQVVFNGKQTDKLSEQPPKCDVIGCNGLKVKNQQDSITGKKLSTYA